jgi:hypothetical protein
LVLLAVTVILAVVDRLRLIEARELLAETYVLSQLAEVYVVKGREDEAKRVFAEMQREIMQYATVRHVRHSSLRWALCCFVNSDSPKYKKLDVFHLSELETEKLLSYTKEYELGISKCTEIENFLYKKWPGSREHWPAWGGAESGQVSPSDMGTPAGPGMPAGSP